MLLVMRCISDVDIPQILPVYDETIGWMERKRYRGSLESAFGMSSQDRFTEDLCQFFEAPGSKFFVWTAQGKYVSAVRAEQFADGMLLSYLETDPVYRGKGYARSLVGAAVQYLEQNGHERIYSHIEKRNVVSMAVHMANGFQTIADHATLLDGTVSQKYYTLQYVSKESTAG